MMWLRDHRTDKPTDHWMNKVKRGCKNKQYLLIPTIVKLLQSFVFFPKTTIKRFLWLLQRVDLFCLRKIIRYLPLRAVDLTFSLFVQHFDLCHHSTQTLMLEITPTANFAVAVFSSQESKVVFATFQDIKLKKRIKSEWFCVVTTWESSSQCEASQIEQQKIECYLYHWILISNSVGHFWNLDLWLVFIHI